MIKDGCAMARESENAMNVKLTPHSESLLRESLARGGYRTPEEVIERALEILAEREAKPEGSTSIMQLQGLGKEIWQGIDAQEYVNQERAAWNG
jgi:Arc/MetJ-type ribon-helix-helix transcriptional regulator